ncbi:MAG: YfhO family protein [candidate division WOR-3 bacterium]|nr:YfhO family protein [candidate division WOR-3 bacterium]
MKSEKRDKVQMKQSSKIKLPAFLYCLMIIILLLLIYYYDLLAQKRFLWDDVLYQWYPFLSFAKDCLKSFKLPVWNPYVFSGVPYLNDLSILTFYPINWFFLFLNGSAPLQFIQIELMMIFHLLLAGCFVYLFLKEMKVDWQGRIFGAIIMTFSGYVSLRAIQISPVSIFAWSFLLFYFFVRILTKENFSDAFLGGIFLGIAILASHPQFILYFIYALVIYYIYHTIVFERNNLKKYLPLSLAKIIIFFLVGIGIAMIQYYPSLKYVPYTLREKMTYEQTTDGSLLPKQLLCIFLPKFFGSVTGGGTDSVPFWANQYGHYYWESGIYLGVLPLVLAVFAIFYSPRKVKYIFLIIAVLALLFAMGRYFPLYKFFWHIIPGLKRFRFPVRFLSVYTISLGVLAVFGLEYFLSINENVRYQIKRFSKYLLIALGITAFCYLLFISGVFKDTSRFFSRSEIYANSQKQLGIFFVYLLFTWLLFLFRSQVKTKTSLLIGLIGLISFIDLYQFGNKFSKGFVSPSEYYPYSRLIANLQQERQKEIFRIRTREDGYMILKRNEGCLWKLEALEGYTSLNLERYYNFKLPVSRWTELLNAKYLIKVDTNTNRMGLDLNPKYLSRAFFCSDYRVIKDDNEILNLLANDSFDVSQIVVLEEEPKDKLSGQKANAQVSIQQLDIDYIKVLVHTDQPGFLVLSEIYYPEWKACIDKKVTKIYRADFCLRAVYVPQGEHIVEFYYDKHNIKVGGFITLITLIISLVMILSIRSVTRKE